MTALVVALLAMLTLGAFAVAGVWWPLFAVVVLITVTGWIGIIAEALDRTPLPLRPDPRGIFRFVHREDRAAYRRMMRRTFAVQVRDMTRALAVLSRTIGKALLPSLEKLASAFRAVFDGPSR